MSFEDGFELRNLTFAEAESVLNHDSAWIESVHGALLGLYEDVQAASPPALAICSSDAVANVEGTSDVLRRTKSLALCPCT